MSYRRQVALVLDRISGFLDGNSGFLHGFSGFLDGISGSLDGFSGFLDGILWFPCWDFVGKNGRLRIAQESPPK